MLAIYEGSIEETRDAMKRQKALNRQEIVKLTAMKKKLRKKVDRLEKGHSERFQLLSEVSTLSKRIRVLQAENGGLSVTHVIPVQLGDFIYNYRFIEALSKKLRGYSITIDMDHMGTLFITYQNIHSKGRVILHPLSIAYTFRFPVPKAKAQHPIPGNKNYYRGVVEHV